MSGNRRPYARVRFAKRGALRFVGHLDLARAFDRAIRRAGLPVAYTQGFNPRARIAFAPPLPVGAEGEAEMCIIDLAQEMDANEIRDRLARELPPDLPVVDVATELRGRRSPIADISVAEYEVRLRLTDTSDDALSQAVADVLDSGDIEAVRSGKSGDRACNIRPAILSLEYRPGEPPGLHMRLRIGAGPSAKPAEVVDALSRAVGGGGRVAIARLVRSSLA